MVKHSAALSRQKFEVGCALAIYGTAQPEHTLAIITPNGSPLTASVAAVGPNNLQIDADGVLIYFEPWRDGDDPLPNYLGRQFRWTQI